MTYPADFEKKLGFDQIREKLTSYCLCSLGHREVEALSFRNTLNGLLPDLEASHEMVGLLQTGDSFSFNNFFDPTELYQVIAWEGSFLEEDVFRYLILSLQTIFEAQKFLKNQERYPRLAALAEPVTLPRSVLTSLQSKFDDFGKVRDNASSELQQIRRRLLEEQGRVRRVADAIFRSASEQGWVPEGMTPSIREGRLVIPILAAHKRRIRGHVMDESATGQTVFIEPAEVMEANNELRDLQLAERREVVKILKELTDLLRTRLEEIKVAYHFMAQLDLNRAKAKLAIELEATLPEIVEVPALKWVEAKHPLLFLSLRGKRPVVPLNIELTSQQHLLLVSGPNAGGKSVCLKTVGLLQYMLQCGLLVPMQPHSRMGLFQQIFLDIGDQQSIENDLSTYSSHLTNMAWFLTHGNARTLVLMDELGSGTDPNFGGGIAQAILAELAFKKVWGVATTHYYNLKLLAESTPGLVNGAMLFNTQRLEPLFILEIGKPGSSFALEIARKIGLPAQTVASAEAIIGKDLTGLEVLMKSVAEEKINNARRQAELQKKEQQLTSQLQRYHVLSEELETRKKEIIEKAKTEAARLLKETNREIEKTIRHIRENKAERKETRKVREGLKGLTEKVKIETPVTVHKTAPLQEGDKVRLRGQEVTGTIVQLKGKTAIVLFGSVRSQLKIDQLVRSDQAEPLAANRPTRAIGIDLVKRQAHFETTLDVRGKRAEEVVPLLSQFLDDAVLLGHGELKILHGKGEGVLRNVVRDHLKKTSAVASFADEHVERGGDGITVVVLK
ncbi:MAG: endonuclease MutS2 [Bacteroidota bacterium]